MVGIIKESGQNAGCVWEALNLSGPLSEIQLIEKTKLKPHELHAAIGWLAREGKIFKEDELYMLDVNDLPAKTIENDMDQLRIETIIDEGIIIQEESFETIEPADRTTLDTVKGIEASDIKMETAEISSNVLSDISKPIEGIASKGDIDTKEDISKMDIGTNIDATEDISNVTKSINEIANENELEVRQDSWEIEAPTLQIKKPIPPWRWKDNSVGTCDICKRVIVFEKNLSGLVISDEFFACEDCCKNTSKDELAEWTKSRMTKPADVRPIGIWLTQEQNKDRTTIFKK